jgi:hypothetical protein
MKTRKFRMNTLKQSVICFPSLETQQMLIQSKGHLWNVLSLLKKRLKKGDTFKHNAYHMIRKAAL